MSWPLRYFGQRVPERVSSAERATLIWLFDRTVGYLFSAWLADNRRLKGGHSGHSVAASVRFPPESRNQRNRARALLKAARARDPEALRRFTADPRVRASRDFSLHHAQLVIAREHGLASWAKLKAHVDAASFVLIALLDAANRALETDAKDALFCDSLARPLAGEVGIALHNATRTMTWPPDTQGAAPELSILTRYFDDALSDAVHRLSLREILILGLVRTRAPFACNGQQECDSSNSTTKRSSRPGKTCVSYVHSRHAIGERWWPICVTLGARSSSRQGSMSVAQRQCCLLGAWLFSMGPRWSESFARCGPFARLAAG